MEETGGFLPRIVPIFGLPRGSFCTHLRTSRRLILAPSGETFWDRSGALFWSLPGTRFGALWEEAKIKARNRQVLVGTRGDTTWTTTQNWGARTPEIEPGGGPTLAGNIWWRRPGPHGSQISEREPQEVSWGKNLPLSPIICRAVVACCWRTSLFLLLIFKSKMGACGVFYEVWFSALPRL